MTVCRMAGPIQGKGQDHMQLKVRNSKSISFAIFNGSWQMTADFLTRARGLEDNVYI